MSNSNNLLWLISIFFTFTFFACELDINYDTYCKIIAECGEHGNPVTTGTNFGRNACYCNCEEGWYGKSCEFKKSDCKGTLTNPFEGYDICVCKCPSFGIVNFDPPDCSSININLKKTNLPAKKVSTGSSDYFPLNTSNYWFYNTLDSVGEINGEFGFEVQNFYTKSDTTYKPTSFYLPDSLGIAFDTFPRYYFEIESQENEIYTSNDDTVNQIFMYHDLTIGDTLINDEDTAYIYDWGTVNVPAGEFENCLAFLAPDSSGMILAPDVGMVAYLGESEIFAELKSYELYCSFAVNISVVNESCLGSNDALFNIALVGDTTGMDELTYQWSGPTEIPLGQDPINLSAGYYHVTISNADCQTTVDSLLITSNPPIDITLVALDHVSCFGESDGSIDVTISGGSGNLSYSWNEGAYDSPNISGLPSGSYKLEVMDSLGCIETLTIDIEEPANLTSNPIIENISCNGSADGQISPSINGGNPTYQYMWSNGSQDTQIGNLPPGVYNLTVVDAENCQAEFTYTVTEPELLIVDAAETDVKCNGINDGEIVLDISGGIAPYSINWNTGETTLSIDSLFAGFYSATVTDANGCSMELETALTEPDPIVITPSSISNSTCYQSADGEVVISVVGGLPPYDILWNNGASGLVASNLAFGDYQATLTDANNCVDVYLVTITEPDSLKLTLSSTVSQVGMDNGSARVEVEGGITPYTYLWNDNLNQTTQEAINLSPGFYTVLISDFNICMKEGIVEVKMSTSVENIEDDTEIFVYPVPAQEIIYLEITDPIEKINKITIYDVNGKILKRHTYDGIKLTPIDIINLNSGIYLLFIKTTHKTMIRKFIKS